MITAPHGSLGTLESANHRHLSATGASATIFPGVRETEKQILLQLRGVHESAGRKKEFLFGATFLEEAETEGGMDSLQIKWFAWAAEYPQTSIFGK